MPGENFATLRKFNDKALADEFIELLKSEKISYLLENTSGFDASFSCHWNYFSDYLDNTVNR